MHRHTILYAEDEDATRENYTNYLRRYFSKVYAIDNGLGAISLYHEKKPDILLLDINMPHKNGLEVAREIRNIDKQVRIIMLTAHLERDKLLFATELGLTKYLPKPTRRGELKSALAEAVAQIHESEASSASMSLGQGFEWNSVDKTLHDNSDEVKLTKYEILLLDLLSQKPRHIFSVDEIALHIWNDNIDAVVSTRKIKDIIKRIRKKLPHGMIENIYGAGFRLKDTSSNPY